MKYIVKQAESNSKGVTHTVFADAHILAHVRETDLTSFLASQETADASPVAMTNERGYDFLTCRFRVKRLVGSGSRSVKAFDTVTLGYSPQGQDLTGYGSSTFVNADGFCLTAHYVKPQALPILADDGILVTDHGKFAITRDVRGYYSAKKVD